MADDMMTHLRSLANRWTVMARDFARASKQPGTSEAQAAYDRGFAEGYYKAATELATLLKELETTREPEQAAPLMHAPPPRPGSPVAQRPAMAPPQPPVAPPEPTAVYLPITVAEALSVLEFAGTHVRDIQQGKDNSFRATFSSWENMMPHERLERIQKTDNRIVILKSGKLESHDHFIEFAFKENGT